MAVTHINLATGAATELPHDASPPRAPTACVWLDVSAPTEADLAWLERAYGFHPLALEDCRHFEQRAKVDAYEGYVFISVEAVTRRAGDLHTYEMETFLGADYLITVHRKPIAAIEEMRRRCVSDHRTGAYRADELFYQIVDQMVDALFPLLDEIEDEIDALEDEVLDARTHATVERLFHLKRQLIELRKIVGPMRDAMDALADTRYEIIDARTAPYFRDVYDHLVRVYDLIETSRDLLSGALDAYLSTVSNRLNDVMKRLTLFTTIFMPISFLVGFGGMNFQQLPFADPLAFGLVLLLIALFPMAMLVYYRWSGWL